MESRTFPPKPQTKGSFGVFTSQLDTTQELVSHLSRGPSQEEHFTKDEMIVYLDAQKCLGESIAKMKASVSMLEKAYVKQAKTHATLQHDFKVEKRKEQKERQIYGEDVAGHKNLIIWGQLNKNIPTTDAADNDKYSFLSKEEGDDDDNEEDARHSSAQM